MSDAHDLTRYDPTLPLPNAAEETYAFERALGYGMREAVKRAGGKPQNGTGSKYEAKAHIQARIKHLRGLDEEMLREKRARIEARLNVVAFGNIFEFCRIEEVDRMVIEDGLTRMEKRREMVIDWDRLNDSDLAILVSELKFNPKTREVIGITRDDALAALAQLRDMHGFKSPAKTELTGKDGSPLTLDALVGASFVKKVDAA